MKGREGEEVGETVEEVGVEEWQGRRVERDQVVLNERRRVEC